MIKLWIATLSVTFMAVEAADSALSLAPCYRRAKVRTLDSLFGPEEPFEFTGPTTPPIS